MTVEYPGLFRLMLLAGNLVCVVSGFYAAFLLQDDQFYFFNSVGFTYPVLTVGIMLVALHYINELGTLIDDRLEKLMIALGITVFELLVAGVLVHVFTDAGYPYSHDVFFRAAAIQFVLLVTWNYCWWKRGRALSAAAESPQR